MIEAIKQIDGYAEMTPQEIADALKATGVTAWPIDRAELVHLLNLRGMLRKIVGNNSDEKWTGSVLAMQDAILAAGTDAQKEAIRLWFSHITNVSNVKWDTTDQAFAVGFWQMFQAFKDLTTMPTTADFEAIADLGGGWRFAGVTAEQVQSALNAEELTAIRDTTIAPLQSKLNAIATWLNTEEALAMSPAEYQAYADELLASVDGNPSGSE